MSGFICYRIANLIMALALAFASVQFASHSVRPAVTDPALIEYLAAGGSLSDLCLSSDASHDHGECPFCREVDFVALDTPSPSVARAFLCRDILVPTPITVTTQALPKTGHPVRAPPVFL